MADAREGKVQRLEEVYRTYAQFHGVEPWEQVRQWAIDAGWGEEYPELEAELHSRIAPELKADWARQLNERNRDRLKRPVSTRFAWMKLALVRMRVKGEDGEWRSEVRPSGHTTIPNVMIFDPRLRDEDLRLYAILKATSVFGIATVPLPFMAASLEVTEDTIRRRLDNLREAGYIADEPKRGARPQSYRLFLG